MSRSTDPPASDDLAPRWHTAALVGLILTVAVLGTLLLRHHGPSPPSQDECSRIAAVYAPTIVVQWALVFYVCRVGRHRSALRFLLGRRWRTLGDAAVDLLLALAGCIVIEGGEMAAAALLGAHSRVAVEAVLPATPLERALWIGLALTVGFSEEVVYRGYLRVQLAFAGRSVWGIALQAALFGIAHLEQGAATAARLALYAVGLGALARWRRSLLPGILCHVAIDLLSGLARS